MNLELNADKSILTATYSDRELYLLEGIFTRALSRSGWWSAEGWLAEERRLHDGSLGQLRDEVEQQRKRVDADAVTMAKIRERDRIVDPNPSEYGGVIGGAERNIVEIENRLIESRAEFAKLNGQMVEIRKLKPEDLKEAVRVLGVTRFLQSKRIYEAAKAKLETELLERSIDRLPGL